MIFFENLRRMNFCNRSIALSIDALIREIVWPEIDVTFRRTRCATLIISKGKLFNHLVIQPCKDHPNYCGGHFVRILKLFFY